MELAMATGHAGDLTPLTAEQIGGVLAFARRDKDFSVAYVAQELRIPKSYIQAIENSDYDALPGVAYIPGYLRSYAKLLEVDPTPLVNAYKESLRDDEVKPKYVFPEQILTPKMAGSVVAMLTVVLGLVGYVGWFLFERPVSDIEAPQEIAGSVSGSDETSTSIAIAQNAQPTDADDIVATTSEADTQTLVPLPEFEIADDKQAGPVSRPDNLEQLALPEGTNRTVLASVREAAEASEAAKLDTADEGVDIQQSQSDSVAETPAVPILANEDTTTPQTSEVELASLDTQSSADDVLALDETNQEPASANPASANATAVNPTSEILIRAVSASWVEIVRDNGEIVVSKLLRSGDQLAASSEGNLFLSTGNAGGLTLETVSLDAFRVGKVGEILRDFPLTSDMLRDRQAQVEN